MGRWPDGAAQGIGEAIMRTVEMLAILSAMCALGSGVCLILARRSTGGRARVFRWLALLLAVAAVIPPVFVVVAVGR